MSGDKLEGIRSACVLIQIVSYYSQVLEVVGHSSETQF